MIGPRLLYALAVLFGAAGLAFRFAPAASPVPAAARPTPTGPTPIAVVPPSTGTGGYDAIIASNVFSTTRAAPATRLVPEGLRRDTQTVAARRAKPAEPATPVYGITWGTEGAVALIDADPDIPGAEVYRVGDQVRGARITAITDSTVVLGRPSGSIVLRLPATDGARR